MVGETVWERGESDKRMRDRLGRGVREEIERLITRKDSQRRDGETC